MLEQLDRDSYHEALAQTPDARFHQLWDYEAQRQDCQHEAVRTSGGALAMVRIKTLPGIGRGLAYISSGPALPGSDLAEAELAGIVSELRREYVERRRLVLRINPPLSPARAPALRAALVACDFRSLPANRGYRTILVPLGGGEEEVRRQFNKSLRYGINRGLRNDFDIEEGSGLDPYGRFLKLYDEMWERKRFETGVDPRWVRRVQEQLPEKFKLRIRVARLDGVDLAATVHSLVGDTLLSLLGATKVEENATPARRYAAHTLHWSAIRSAVAEGLCWYDLGGIDPETNPGGHTFKEAFGGDDVSSLGVWEAGRDVVSRLAVRLGEGLRNRRQKEVR
jgi:hypothetical protein